MPTFDPTGGAHSGLDVLASAAAQQSQKEEHQLVSTDGSAGSRSLQSRGPYNPAATLPPKVVKKIMALEFVEMAELRADIWPDDSTPADSGSISRRPSKPPITNIRSWLECYARMAAVLTTRFPEKAAELWAYQTTILHTAHAYEGANWVAYDRLYRREMLANKDLNWSMPNPRLYSQAFTGRAKRHPQCPHCLSEDHGAPTCPHNPNPPIMGWFQGSPPTHLGAVPAQLPPGPSPLAKPVAQEVCRNFNSGRCRFTRCRYLHICSDCSGTHAVLVCPSRQTTTANQGGPIRARNPTQPRPARTQPYGQSPSQGVAQPQ